MPVADTKYTIAQDYTYDGDDWWHWWIWIEGSSNDLDRVEYVTYTLHATFHNPVRKVEDRDSKFTLKTEGWGTFIIYAKLMLKDKNEIPPEHKLNLKYPDGRENGE